MLIIEHVALNYNLMYCVHDMYNLNETIESVMYDFYSVA